MWTNDPYYSKAEKLGFGASPDEGAYNSKYLWVKSTWNMPTLDRLEEMDKILETYNFLRLNQEETENLNSTNYH